VARFLITRLDDLTIQVLGHPTENNDRCAYRQVVAHDGKFAGIPYDELRELTLIETDDQGNVVSKEPRRTPPDALEIPDFLRGVRV
jgi:hypothetical protein